MDYSYVDNPVVGPLVRVTALTRVEGGTTTDAGSQTWVLRRDDLANPMVSVAGPLSVVGAEALSIYFSPRLVTPDGVCTVYLAPFSNLSGPVAGPKVAVLGDDLTHQLGDATYNQTHWQGYVEGGLAALGIRSEVEGHIARRWTPVAGTTGQPKSDSYLLDEFRGLLEHDVDGYVMALGVNDALYIAAGADEPARLARRDEVFNALSGLMQEMQGRTSCVAVVTAPENASSLDPEYAWAAQTVNSFFRYIGALGTPTDQLEVVDFGAQASGQPWFEPDGVHLNSSGRLAYTAQITTAGQRCADSVVLWGGAGTLDQGALGGMSSLPSGQAFSRHAVDDWNFGDKAPHFSTIAADGTMFFGVGGPAGNVYIGSGEGMEIAAFNPTSRSFTPIPIRTDANVRVPQASCHGRDPTGPLTWDWCQTASGPNPSYGLSGSSGDVEALSGGQAVAFTNYNNLYLGQDLDSQGEFPVFGVVTKDAQGNWHIAEGPDSDGDGKPDWRNAWSSRQLYEETVRVDPSSQPLAETLCPEFSLADDGDGDGEDDGDGVNLPPVRHCGLFVNELALLPRSGNVAITHYVSADAVDNKYAGMVSVLDVGEPDATGRISVRIDAVERFSDLDGDGTAAPIDDPGWPDVDTEPPASAYAPGEACDPDGVGPRPPLPLPDPNHDGAVTEEERTYLLAPSSVQSDPTSVLGDERFAVASDRYGWRYTDSNGDAAGGTRCVAMTVVPDGIIEFSYDPGAADPEDRVRPVSPPIFSGVTESKREPLGGPTNHIGYGPHEYDRDGNLWIPSLDGWNNRGVSVFANTATGRKISTTCVETVDGQPRPIHDYMLPSTPVVDGQPGVRAAWGRVCPPDYDIQVPQGWLIGLEDDPVTGNMFFNTYPSGTAFVIDPDDPTNDGRNMTFRVSGVTNVAVGMTSEQTLDGICPGPGQPDEPCTDVRTMDEALPGPIDSTGRAWIIAKHRVPFTMKGDSPEMMRLHLDQWLYSVDTTRLLGREARRLTVQSGQETYVHAEHTDTLTTTESAGADGRRIFRPAAPAEGCVQDPGANPFDPNPPQDPNLGFSCVEPVTGIRGGGFAVTDATGPGGGVEYEIVVPKDGRYTLVYRAADRTRPIGGPARIRTVVDGGDPTDTSDITSNVMSDIDGPTLDLTAGTHSIQVSTPDASFAGWSLDYLLFTRV